MAIESVAMEQATRDIARVSALLDGVQCIVEGFIDSNDVTVARQAFVVSTTLGQLAADLSEIERQLNAKARASAGAEGRHERRH
jgi:hypothetical protein